MQTSVTIDWLSVTMPLDAKQLYPKKMRLDYQDATPARGYNLSRRFVGDGRHENRHTERNDMGIHIVYSGSCLNYLRNAGISSLDIIHFYLNRDAKIARLDIALDVRDAGLKIDNLYTELIENRAETKARKFPRILSQSGQGTLYIGSRTSESFCRIYDKGDEQGTKDDYIRVEMELKGGKARSMARSLHEHTDHTEKLVKGAIRGMVNFPDNPKWNEIMNDVAIVEVLSEKKKESDTRGWLLGQVVTALAHVMIDNGNDGFFEEFQFAVLQEYERLKSEIKQ